MHYLVAAALVFAVGILSGSLSALFLYALDGVTAIRETSPWFVIGLPLAGFLVGWLYRRFGPELEAGNNLILEELHDSQRQIPARLAPLVLFGTLATHLFGGSAGREGTAVQMGGAVAEFLSSFQKTKLIDRRSLLRCGMAAGFASVFGTPVAGLVFTFEVLTFRYLRKRDVVACAAAAITGHLTALVLGAHHADYKSLMVTSSYGGIGLLSAIAAGLAFGLTARCFAYFTHQVSRIFSSIRYSPLRPLVGGSVFAVLILGFGLERYEGLGLAVISNAFSGSIYQSDFVFKLALTALTLGSGFKGGEVTPLFFIGATLGHTLSRWLFLPPALLASLGFIGVFAGAANVPIASIVMGVELFGWSALPYFVTACVVSFAVSGRYGIYRAQRPDHFRFKLF